MSNVLKLALIQQQASQNVESNIKRGISAFEQAAREGAKCVIFPELAFLPFYPQKPAQEDVIRLAETIPGPTTDRFCALARKWKTVVILNLFEKEGSITYDSSPVIDADGSLLGVTRMVHILEAPSFHEQGYYTAGNNRQLVYDTMVGRIGVAICYDRHFPEYMRALGLLGAELVVIPQAGSVGEWTVGLYEAEMQVASFQNGYFTALCNRVGREECLTFEGKSFVTAPDGRIIIQAQALKDQVTTVDINLDEVHVSHAKLHFLPDRRPELYTAWFKNNIQLKKEVSKAE